MKLKITFEATVDMTTPEYLEKFLIKDIVLGITNDDPTPQIIMAGSMSVSDMRIQGECEGNGMYYCNPDHHLISDDDPEICAYCDKTLKSLLKSL